MAPEQKTEKLRPGQRGRKLTLAAVGVILLACLAFIRPPDGLPELSRGFKQIGLALILVGVLGRVWCTMHIGGQKFTALVTAGPFSLCRNPLYLFSMIATFGAGLQSGSLLFACFATIGAWAVTDATVRREEKALEARFGEEYRSYCAQTPRYLPRFAAWKGEDTVTVQMPLVYRTLSDGALFYASAPVCAVIDWAQVAGYLPVLARLPI